MIPKMRTLLAENKVFEAEYLMCEEFKKKNYQPSIGRPMPLGDIQLITKNNDGFKKYERRLDMSLAEATVQRGKMGAVNIKEASLFPEKMTYPA